MRYIDMTPEQRKDAFGEHIHAMSIHAQGFALRPGYTSADRAAERHWRQVTREAKFILRCARSRGDAWTEGVRL